MTNGHNIKYSVVKTLESRSESHGVFGAARNGILALNQSTECSAKDAVRSWLGLWLWLLALDRQLLREFTKLDPQVAPIISLCTLGKY